MTKTLFVLVILLSVSVPAFPQSLAIVNPDSIPFAPAVNYSAGNNPRSVFCADLDRDGYLDLAVANLYSNNVSIFKNNGDGTFQSKVDYSAGDGPASVFCADLDGDGYLDLALANLYSSTVSILRNNRDGTFQTKVDYPTGSGPNSVFCADLDGDGDLDLATANWWGNSVSILKNNGDATFQTKVDYGAGVGPLSVFCADLNGDLDQDLAVANHGSDNVSILKNNGDGTFQTKVDYSAGAVPHSVFCVDLDGDSDLDLAVANHTSDNASILKNNGNGTFQTRIDYASADEPHSVFCGDLDGDFDLDLAVANLLSRNVSILKNNGDATFQTKVDYSAGDSPISVFCADLDEDGDLDLAVANAYDGVSILRNLTNNRPSSYSLVSPLNNDSVKTPVTLAWQPSIDPDPNDTVRYDLYLSRSVSFNPESTIVYSSLLDTTFTDSLASGLWYWKVKAYDKWGAVKWSDQTWTFYVCYPPDFFALISPLDNDSIRSPVTLDWQACIDLDSNDTVRYELYLSRSIVFSPESTVLNDSLLDTTFVDTLDLKTWYWRVKAYDRWGAIRWSSQSWSFYVFILGDVNTNAKINLADVIFLANYVLKAGSSPIPMASADVDCDGKYTLVDVIKLARYVLFGEPFPC